MCNKVFVVVFTLCILQYLIITLSAFPTGELEKIAVLEENERSDVYHPYLRVPVEVPGDVEGKY